VGLVARGAVEEDTAALAPCPRRALLQRQPPIAVAARREVAGEHSGRARRRAERREMLSNRGVQRACVPDDVFVERAHRIDAHVDRFALRHLGKNKKIEQTKESMSKKQK
jgi:hypothetical protein